MKQYFLAVGLLLVLVIAYFWVKTPALVHYSLQAFFAALASYLILKRFKRAQSPSAFWHLAPRFKNLEILLLTFAVLMLVTATGSLDSILFPLLYVLLFFMVFSTDDITSIVASSGLSLFFYSLTDLSAQSALASLISLPLVTVFFLLAKKQYDIAVRESSQLFHQDDWNVSRSDSTGWFMVKFLKPSIIELKELSGNPDKNQDQMLQKLVRIESRLNQLIKEFAQQEKPLMDEVEQEIDTAVENLA
jgi:hypothetical protein